jgi:hypothetical protein
LTTSARALQVLEGLIPEELRPLCINLLGSGLEEKRSLESSVGGILHKNDEWNEARATEEREGLEQRLRALREEKAGVDRRLRGIRESQTHSQSIAEGAYRGTAARIAQVVNRDRSDYQWFTDKAALDKTSPISESDLQSVLAALRRLTPEKRQEASLAWPDALPSPERFASLVECERQAIQEESVSTQGADEQIANHLSNVDAAAIQAIHDSLSSFPKRATPVFDIALSVDGERFA